MQQTELESLLEELRRTQDHRPPPAPASAPASAPADPDPVFPIPTQDQLASLLSSLTAPQQPQLPPPQPQPRDLTALSFPESLPILQHLGADPDFLEALAQIKSDQADEEMRMRDERNRLEGEGKRGGLSQHVQTQRLRDWDRKALVRWRVIREAQQGQLEEMGVPSFFRTDDPIALRKQARVMGVLIGFLDD